MCIRLNKAITIYICPSTTTYINRRENKEVIYNFIHGSKFETQPRSFNVGTSKFDRSSL